MSINGISYELSIRDDEKIINEIKDLFKINKIDEILNNSIDKITSMESDYNE